MKSESAVLFVAAWVIKVPKTWSVRQRLRSMSRTRSCKPGQIRLHVMPQHGGAFTRWRLTGSMVTTVPHRELRHLFRRLSFWSGWPVHLVLPADAGTVAWFDWWTAAIDGTTADHLVVQFDLTEHRRWASEPKTATRG